MRPARLFRRPALRAACTVVLAAFLGLPLRAEREPSARELVQQAADASVRKDYRTSSALLVRARRLAEESKDYEQLFWVYSNLGINQAELLNYDNALQNFTEAYKIARRHLDNRRVLSIRNNMAGLYMMNHDNEKALDEYLKIYADVKDGRDSVFIGGCALNIATLLVTLGDCSRAQPYLLRAERLLGRYPENKVSLVALRADFLRAQHLDEAAYRLVLRAQDSSPELAADAYLRLLRARTALAVGRAEEAAANAQDILAHGGADLTMKRAIFELLPRAYEALGHYKPALDYKDSLLAVTDSLANLTGRKQFESRQIQFEIWQKQQEIDNYRSRHRLELALTILGFVASAVLVWALLSQVKAARQQRRLSALELEREHERRAALQRKMAEEQAAHAAEQEARRAEREESRRTIEKRGRELMAKALTAANQNDAVREMLHALESAPEVKASKNATLKRKLAALRHRLDSSVEWKDFTTYFEQANAAFIAELRRRHPVLTANDVRYLSLVYINLTSKEIALLLNITPEYCKKKKQQVARKMGLSDPRALYAYLTELTQA